MWPLTNMCRRLDFQGGNVFERPGPDVSAVVPWLNEMQMSHRNSSLQSFPLGKRPVLFFFAGGVGTDDLSYSGGVRQVMQASHADFEYGNL
jgi:hypothetical protein